MYLWNKNFKLIIIRCNLSNSDFCYHNCLSNIIVEIWKNDVDTYIDYTVAIVSQYSICNFQIIMSLVTSHMSLVTSQSNITSSNA